MLRWIGFVLLVLTLLLTAFTGLTGGLIQVHRVTGAGQWAATFCAFSAFASGRWNQFTCR